jgi:putative Ca2+/H+ antiporter (TMEM165/GDT1 family)
LEYQANLASCLYVKLLRFAFLIALILDNEIGSKSTFSPFAFTSNKRSFYFVPMGIAFSTTFAHVASVSVCAVSINKRKMMVTKVVVFCCVAILGYLKPKFP